MFLLKGSMKAYDGNRHYSMKEGDYFIARKNHLIRYTKFRENNQFAKVIITFDEAFLIRFLERHPHNVKSSALGDSFVFIKENKLLKNYIQSLEPYYTGNETLEVTFADIKREELLLIILKTDPEFANILFNFGRPGKIDLEEFMNRNFRFNVSIERFAFLTGRSLSAFKRDFKEVFNETPNRWLVQKRLKEAYFLLEKENKKPSEIYLDLGFETPSHFSFAFKKQFGLTPTELKPPTY